MIKKWRKTIIISVSLILLAFASIFAWFFHPVLKPIDARTGNRIEGGDLPPGCSCHSKNPRLASMHGLFGIKDCIKCHEKSENLTSRRSKKMTPARKTALEQRMRKEATCQQCHIKGEVLASKKSTITGRLFSRQDQKMYKKEEAIERNGKYYCPKHNVELIDIDEIAVESAKEPKNEYCIACHPVNQELQKKHSKVSATAKDSSIEDCLKCHTSHSKCGGCHF